MPVSTILGPKILLVSIAIFRLGGTTLPPPSPHPPPGSKLRRRGPCKTDNCSGCHGKISSCLARLVVPDSPTRRGGSADLYIVFLRRAPRTGSGAMILGRFSVLQSSASRSQFWFQSSPSKSGHSKHQIFTFGAYFRFWQDLWLFGVASRLPKVVTVITRFSRL